MSNEQRKSMSRSMAAGVREAAWNSKESSSFSRGILSVLLLAVIRLNAVKAFSRTMTRRPSHKAGYILLAPSRGRTLPI